jgi:hypothetical protein
VVELQLLACQKNKKHRWQICTKKYFGDKIKGNDKSLKYRTDVGDWTRTQYFEGKI